MVPALLTELAAAAADLRLQPGQRATGNMTFYSLATPDGKPVSFLLAPVGSYPATVPFEPSVYGAVEASRGRPCASPWTTSSSWRP